MHVRHKHHKTIVKCQKCGRELIHEKDRLHHARKGHEEEMREHSNRKSYHDEYKTHSRVDRFRANFMINFNHNILK